MSSGLIFTSLTTLLFAPLAVSVGFARTIQVPADYARIQDAIDAAASWDTVLVSAGTYWGAGNTALHFDGKAIFLRSRSGREMTTIECQGAPEYHRRGIHLWGGMEPGGEVDGFTIRDGIADGPGYEGGGALLANTAVRIRNCAFVNCYASRVGGAHTS